MDSSCKQYQDCQLLRDDVDVWDNSKRFPGRDHEARESANILQVVEQDSALLKWGNEKPVPMNSNHLDICRFSKRGEPDYLKVITRLKEMVEEGVKKFKTSGQSESGRGTG